MPCRACGSLDVRFAYIVRGFEILRCQACRSMTTGVSMAVEEARKFYGHDYFHGGDYEDYPSTERVAKRNFRRFVERLVPLQPAGRLLELGCAYGYFLDVAREHWDVAGIDLSPVAVAACAQRFGPAVICGDLLTVDLPIGHYDLVAAWDMIEHVNEPAPYVKRAFDLLRPGGHLVLTTGDVSSPAARLLGRRWRLMTPPSHLTFFSRHGMLAALTRAGYEDVRFETAGYARAVSFVLFRLFGHADALSRLREIGPFRRLLDAYVDLDIGDIMFVIARKPGGAPRPAAW